MYAGGAEEDARRLVDAEDGESIRVDQPDRVNTAKFGGVDSNLLAFTLNANDQASRLAGNLDMLGGLGAQSDTLGQDRLIAQSASMRLAEMQSRSVKFAKTIMEQIGWYIWTDPNLSVDVEKQVTSRRTRTITFDSSRQEGDYIDYNFEIDPYSMQSMTPQARAEQMLLIHDRVLMPNQAIMQQRGEGFDVTGFAKKLAEYGMVPEMGEFFKAGEVRLDANEEEASARNKPLETKRTYERVSRPMGSRSGKEAALTQTLLGGRGNDDEMDSIGRPGL